MNGNNLWETAFFQLRDLKIYGAAAAGGPAIIGDRNACDALLVDCFVRDDVLLRVRGLDPGGKLLVEELRNSDVAVRSRSVQKA